MTEMGKNKLPRWNCTLAVVLEFPGVAAKDSDEALKNVLAALRPKELLHSHVEPVDKPKNVLTLVKDD